ncbi:hypothetical protein M0802_005430 [Mischocyttarus mexicanus]|nr:hypothetical protein M0802_005430 [Mischocyttarus mexicanus]
MVCDNVKWSHYCHGTVHHRSGKTDPLLANQKKKKNEKDDDDDDDEEKEVKEEEEEMEKVMVPVDDGWVCWIGVWVGWVGWLVVWCGGGGDS